MFGQFSPSVNLCFCNFLSCFCRLVDKINNSIGQDPESKSLIGVLDIYGFESFKTNRFVTATLLVINMGESSSEQLLQETYRLFGSC